MKRVWKYPLHFSADHHTILMPQGAELLHFGNQFETPCVWALIDDEQAPTEQRVVAIVGTGHAAPPTGETCYIGTAQFQGGDFVVHAFELKG